MGLFGRNRKLIEAPHPPGAKAPDGKGSISLWDRAYDSLKEENKTLVTEYEELLCKELAADMAAPGLYRSLVLRVP
jgi:hypothetical protein